MKIRLMLPYRLLLVCLFVVSCQEEHKNSNSSVHDQTESDELQEFFQRELEVDLEQSPMLQTRLGIRRDYGSWDNFSHLRHAEERKKAERRLAFLEDSIDPALLKESEQLSYRLYKRQLQQDLEDYKFRFYNYPVNQVTGVHTALPAFLVNMHDIDSIRDAKKYIQRLNQFPEVIDEVVKGMELREMNHILPPRFVYAQSITAARELLTGKPFEKSKESSMLLADFSEKVSRLDLTSEQESALIRQAQEALVNSVKPSFERLISTLEDQYQRATEEHGVWKFPKGKAFYERMIERYTSLEISPEEVHELGLREVARIQKEMEEAKEETSFEGSLQDLFNFLREDQQFYFENSPEGRQRYLSAAEEILARMEPRLDELFLKIPSTAVKVEPMPGIQKHGVGKSYYLPPAPEGSRPGIYYINLQNMIELPTYQMEAMTYHMGLPGHHLQISRAQQLDDLPMFRRISAYPAYREGWGMYGTKIAKEVRVYEDPYADLGRLALELWRAAGLVVDTGIHQKKWTREEAIEYYMAKAPFRKEAATKMVEQQIVLPGQATAFHIGMEKIISLRNKAEKELGSDFDIQRFHEAVLNHGPLPLDILEEKLVKWIENQKAAE